MQKYGGPQLGLPRLSAVVKKLIIGLFAAYVLQLLLENWAHIPVAERLALTPAGLGLWQLVTYVLVDPGQPLMFLVGLLFIWWALSPFEIGYGPKRTLQLVLVTVLAASVPAYLGGFVLPGAPPLFGSSVLWFGGISATTWLYRDRQLSLFGLMQMSGRQFLLLAVVLSVLVFLFTKNYTQLLADLGAMGGGIAFVRWIKRPRKPPPAVRRPPSRPRNFKVIEGGAEDDRPKWLN